MIEVDVESEIDASPRTVFEFIADPHNHVKFLPSLVDISHVEESEPGKQGRYVFKMVGQEMEGQFVDTEFDRPNRRAYDLTGDFEGAVTWTIEATDGGAHVTYEQATRIPGPDVLDAITDPIAKKFLQREADTMMENVRTLVEEGVTATS